MQNRSPDRARSPSDGAPSPPDHSSYELFRTIPLGVVFHDREGRIVDANPEAERILGLTRAQMEGREPADPGWRATDAEGRPFPGVRHPAMEALRTGRAVRGVAVGVHDPERGEPRWLEVDAIPEFEEGESRPARVYSVLRDVTEAWRTRETLRRTQVRFEVALASPELVLAKCDLELRYTWIHNPLPGFDPATVLGRRDDEIHPPRVSGPWMDFKRRVLAAGAPLRELVVVEPAEGPCYYDVIGRPLRDEGGRVWGISTTSMDVTERVRAEERFRALIEHSSDMITVVESDGTIVYESPSVERVLGWGAAEAQRPNVLERVHPEDREWARSVLHAMVSEPGKRVTAAFRVGHRDGGWRELEATGTNLLNEPSVRGVVVHARDVTERNAAEERIRFQAQVLDAVGEAVVATDLERHVLYVNRFWEQTTGWKESEVLGRVLSELIPGVRPLTRDAGLLERLRRGEVISDDRDATLRDGRTRTFHVNHSPIFDRSGELVAAVASCMDLSERQRLEAQLRQAQKMEAVGQLAGGVAHDFNNVLTAISGYCGLLGLELPPESPASEYVRELQQGVERAAALTHRLLAFSRKQIVQPRVMSLNETVTGLESMLRRLLGEDVELETGLEPALGRIEADPGQVEQIVVNLCVNARDAMPRGGRIRIGTHNAGAVEAGPAPAEGASSTASPEASPPGPGYVVVSVEDTGMGMTPETLERIFEPFFTTKAEGRGTGLGLATVYGIVSQAGGEIRVRSTPGQGSRFDVYLPRVDEADRPAAPPPSESYPGSAGETLLVVEDDAAIRMLLLKVLRRAGYRVLLAHNGQDALTLLDHVDDPVDLVLTDVVMPRLGGRSFIDAVRERLPDARLLVMSGHTDDVMLRHGLRQHEYHFLHKPFRPDALLTRLRAVLDGTTGGDDARERSAR